MRFRSVPEFTLFLEVSCQTQCLVCSLTDLFLHKPSNCLVVESVFTIFVRYFGVVSVREGLGSLVLHMSRSPEFTEGLTTEPMIKVFPDGRQ